MRKILAWILILGILIITVGCKSDVTNVNPETSLTSNEQINTPEEVAAINVESWFEHDFEKMLETYPSFRLRYRALSFAGNRNADIKTVALSMSERYNSSARAVEILNVRITEQREFTEYTIYNELKEDYEDITIEEFKKITDIAMVKVDYSLTTGSETVVLDQELLCIKMDEKWYILKDGAFTN